MIRSVTVAAGITGEQQSHTHTFADACIPKDILTDRDKGTPTETKLNYFITFCLAEDKLVWIMHRLTNVQPSTHAHINKHVPHNNNIRCHMFKSCWQMLHVTFVRWNLSLWRDDVCQNRIVQICPKKHLNNNNNKMKTLSLFIHQTFVVPYFVVLLWNTKNKQNNDNNNKK